MTALQVLAFAVFFGIWQYIYSSSLVPHQLLAPPLDTFTHFFPLVSTHFVYSRVLFSLEVILLAFVTTVLAGMALGMIIGEIVYLRRVLEPYTVLVNSIPRVMFVPLFWAFFGLGVTYQFAFAFISGIFPVLLTTMYSVGNIDPNLVRLSRSLGATSLQLQFKVMIPNIIPSVLSAARLSFNLTLGGVLIAEEFAGTSGVGYLATYFATTQQPISLYVVVTVVALMSILLNLALLTLEKYVIRWNVAHR